MENRKSPRRDVILEVEVTYPSGDKQVVSSRDISDGGMFLVLDQQSGVILGELIGVKLTNESAKKEVLAGTDAIIVHHDSEGIGIAFIQMELDENC